MAIRTLEPDLALVAARRTSLGDGDVSGVAETVKHVFRKHDINGDGFIDEEELAELLTVLSDKFKPGDVKKLLSAADTSGDGKIDFGEFVDWVFDPSVKTGVGLARAVLDYSDFFQRIFSVYDTEGSGVISRASLKECHLIFKSALRLQGICDEEEHRSSSKEVAHDEEEVDLLRSSVGSTGFLEFVDWMKQHVPESMSKAELNDFTNKVTDLLRGAFGQSRPEEDGYVKEDACVLNHICDNLRNTVRACHDDLVEKRRVADTPEKNHWTEPPKGFSVDRLKAQHMTIKPVSTAVVKDVSWEVLCMPEPGNFTDVDSRVWFAEVTRRLLLRTGKLKVENPEYYAFDRAKVKWKPSVEAERHFSMLSAGLGLFCLLKTSANFKPQITWSEIATALDGGVDMRLITDTQIDTFKEEILTMVLSQLQEDGVFENREPGVDKRKYALNYLQHELLVYPEMVMATLLNLGIVESDPAWDDFL